MVCATKVNAVFLFLFAGSGLGFFLFTAALWALAHGNAANGATLLEVSIRPILFDEACANLAQGNRWSMVRHCCGRLVFVNCANARGHGFRTSSPSGRLLQILGQEEDIFRPSDLIRVRHRMAGGSLWGQHAPMDTVATSDGLVKKNRRRYGSLAVIGALFNAS